MTARSKQQPLDYYKALYEIAGEVASANAVENQLDTLVESTTKAIGAKGCSILLLTDDPRKLVHMAAYGLSESYIEKGLVKLDSVTAEALQGTPVVVKDATSDPRVQYQSQAKREGIVSMISLPLMLEGKVAGVLRVYTDHQAEFSINEMAFLSGVANLSATAISKDRLYMDMEQYYKDAINDKMEELARVEEARGRLTKSISVVAHDLKSPLAAIQSYFSMILGGYVGEVNENIRPMIERSSIRIEGLLKMIGDLLDISRIDIGQIAEEMENVSLVQLLEDPLQDTRSLADEKNIIFTVDIPDDLPFVYGSYTRLQQVFANLLSNAVKFTREGGRVNLELNEKDGKIFGTVRDTGIGIPDEDVAYVFKEFYRAGNVAKGSGTGLGLSIVQRIIEAHKGEISVESPCLDTGNGCKFVFTLPISGEKRKNSKKNSNN